MKYANNDNCDETFRPAAKGHEAKDSDYGQTPLLLATRSGHEAVVKLPLDKGVDVEAKDDYGRTSLSWAAEKGRNGETVTERGEHRSLHQCPTCSRIKPFATKQKLRRHFEQRNHHHSRCEDPANNINCRYRVSRCVICTKVFRFVREFQRHAEKCVGENKRKMIHMKDTCEELREISNNELDIALGENEARQSQGKKRTWDEANISVGYVCKLHMELLNEDPPRRPSYFLRGHMLLLDGTEVALAGYERRAREDEARRTPPKSSPAFVGASTVADLVCHFARELSGLGETRAESARRA